MGGAGGRDELKHLTPLVPLCHPSNSKPEPGAQSHVSAEIFIWRAGRQKVG